MAKQGELIEVHQDKLWILRARLESRFVFTETSLTHTFDLSPFRFQMRTCRFKKITPQDSIFNGEAMRINWRIIDFLFIGCNWISMDEWSLLERWAKLMDETWMFHKMMSSPKNFEPIRRRPSLIPNLQLIWLQITWGKVMKDSLKRSLADVDIMHNIFYSKFIHNFANVLKWLHRSCARNASFFDTECFSGRRVTRIRVVIIYIWCGQCTTGGGIAVIIFDQSSIKGIAIEPGEHSLLVQRFASS